jgi:purine-nucleoside phosphorylase
MTSVPASYHMSLEKDYCAKGVEMGSIDLYRNYVAPAEKAMARAIVTIIDDISKLMSPQDSDHKVQ